ncbi:MraY family glycosyltransferase [Sphingobacterium suaedae]|uniref:MraY family glycosyltransferase n=1 Tax=Sphingobacterium suaedae TaxID=1686402 RepID=A0ABW5KKQ2_9SPHI
MFDTIKLLVVGLPFLAAVLLGRALIPYILLVTYKKRLFDPVDIRKLHKNIVPRLGGVAFAPVQCCVLVITLVFLYKLALVDINLHVSSWIIIPSMMLLICGLVMLFVVGIGDDLIGVGYKWKFLIQALTALLLPMGGLWINNLYGLGGIGHIPAEIGIPLTIFLVVLIINAINLIDGLDGLCSGIVVIGSLFLGALFSIQGAWLHAIFAFITAGVLMPFFYFNVFGTWRRGRRIFMGDTGSMTLGYSLAFLVISYATDNQFIKPSSTDALVVACSVIIVPVFDVGRVMLVRWRLGKAIFRPDRNHLHHKFLRAGMSRHSAMVSILLLMVFFCVFNITMVRWMDINVVVLLDILSWLVFHYVFNKLEKRNVIAKGEVFLRSILSFRI